MDAAPDRQVPVLGAKKMNAEWISSLRRISGWLALAGSTAITCFWAMWGIIENFHEGWYHVGLLKNLTMLFGQYLAPMCGFAIGSVIAIYWRWVGAALHLGLAIWAGWFFENSFAATSLIVSPLVLLSAFYAAGEIANRKRAIAILCGCALLTLLACGAEPAWRVAHRLDDGDRGARKIEAGDQVLIWAPRGPGWPTSGTSWEAARSICSRLSEDGTRLHEEPVDIWRLPSAEEAVIAQHRGNRPCGGEYDSHSRRAVYNRRPDKESPLWDIHSQVIYLWTATEVDDKSALMIAYDGNLWSRPKSANWGYLGFRAVKAGTGD